MNIVNHSGSLLSCGLNIQAGCAVLKSLVPLSNVWNKSCLKDTKRTLYLVYPGSDPAVLVSISIVKLAYVTLRKT